MHIKTLSVTSPRVFDKQQRYEPLFKEAIAAFFADRKYGEAVDEIQYVEILTPDEFDTPYDGETAKFIPEEKKITCIIQPNYKKVVTASLSKYGTLLADRYLAITDSFVILGITDFDLQKFKSDLLAFFKDKMLV